MATLPSGSNSASAPSVPVTAAESAVAPPPARSGARSKAACTRRDRQTGSSPDAARPPGLLRRRQRVPRTQGRSGRSAAERRRTRCTIHERQPSRAILVVTRRLCYAARTLCRSRRRRAIVKDASLPITLIVIGVIGLVWYFRWLPDIDWVISLGFVLGGIAVLVVDLFNKNSVVTGPFLIAVGVAWWLRDQYRVSWNFIIPSLLVILGVPMREIAQAATPASFGTEKNPPIVVYDTSGPYTDPEAKIDIRKGLPPLRARWIAERNDTVELEGPTSAYGCARLSDPALAG